MVLESSVVNIGTINKNIYYKQTLAVIVNKLKSLYSYLIASSISTCKCGENSNIFRTHASTIAVSCFDWIDRSKSSKYQGLFKLKSWEKPWQVRETGLNNGSISKSQKKQGFRKGKRPCWHVIPIANAPWKSLVARWRSSSVPRSLHLL